MALGAARGEAVEQGVGEKAPIQDRHGVIGELLPQRLGQGQLARRPRSQAQARQQVRAQHHERDQAQLGIGRRAAAAAGPTEGRLVLGRVRDPQRGAIDPVDRQAAPAVGLGRRPCPAGRRLLEQRRQGRHPEPIAGLHHGAAGGARAAGRGSPAREHQIEVMHPLLDRAVAEQGHPDHDPHDLLGRELAAPHGRRAGRGEGGLDPLQIQRVREDLEAGRAFPRPHRLERVTEIHGSPLFYPGRRGRRGERPVDRFRSAACGRRCSRSWSRLIAESFSIAAHHAR